MNVLKVIKEIKDGHLKKYGNILSEEYSQKELLLTYYVSEVLEMNDHKSMKMVNKPYVGTWYKHDAVNAAFIAGYRAGQQDTSRLEFIIREDAIDEMIDLLTDIKKEGYTSPL